MTAKKTKTKTSAGGNELAAKQEELAKLRKAARPTVFVLLALALATMLSTLGGSALGLPAGLHLFTGGAMVILILLRLPANRRMGALAREIAELKEE